MANCIDWFFSVSQHCTPEIDPNLVMTYFVHYAQLVLVYWNFGFFHLYLWMTVNHISFFWFWCQSFWLTKWDVECGLFLSTFWQTLLILEICILYFLELTEEDKKFWTIFWAIAVMHVNIFKFNITIYVCVCVCTYTHIYMWYTHIYLCWI